jgi:hypothetical protein
VALCLLGADGGVGAGHDGRRTYGDPYDKAVWDTAAEEEEAAIAEQKAMDQAAKGKRNDP